MADRLAPLGVVDPPLHRVLTVVVARREESQCLNEESGRLGNPAFDIRNAVFAAVKPVDERELQLRHLVHGNPGAAVECIERLRKPPGLDFELSAGRRRGLDERRQQALQA